MLSALSSFDEQKEETKATETKEDAENTRTKENGSQHQFQPKGPRMSSPLASWCATCGKHSTNDIHKTGMFTPFLPIPKISCRSTKRDPAVDSPKNRAELLKPMNHQFSAKSKSPSPLSNWCAICHKHANEHHLFKNQFKVTVSMVRQNQEHLRTRRNINNVAGTVVRPVPNRKDIISRINKLLQECPICSESFLNLQNLKCCGQKICSTCVDQIIQTKHTQASEILALYLSKDAHQCPKCELGPVEHFACGDLSGSTFNRCTSCQFSSGNINAWPAWNGVLPKSLQAYPSGQIDCPFCRNTSSLMYGKKTGVFTPRKKQSWKKTIKQIERRNRNKKIDLFRRYE